MEKKTNLRLIAVVVTVVLIGTGSAWSLEGSVFVDDFAGDNTKGRFVMEAENFTGRSTGVSSGWWEVNGTTNRFTEGPSAGEIAPTDENGARENYIEMLGSLTGGIAPTSSSYDGPVVGFKVSVETVGNYNLYARWAGHTYGSDSLYAFILKPDHTLLTGAGPNYFVYHDRNLDWIWEKRGVKNTTYVSNAGFPDNATWAITEPGVYTICIAGRESATALDALIFQTTNLPGPSGLGPPQSLFGAELLGLEIVGPNEVAEDSQTQYKAIAVYDNNSTRDVTALAEWSVEPNSNCSIAAGLLTTEIVDLPEDVTITAQYGEDPNTEIAEKEVSILTICPSGSALDFDGVDDYTDLNHFDLDGNFAVSMWINPHSLRDRQAFIGKHTYDGENIFLFGFYDNGYHLRIRNAWYTEGALTKGWHQLVVVCEKIDSTHTFVKLYKNSILLWAQALNTITGNMDGKAWVIGQDWDSGSKKTDFFNGVIDEVAIYEGALSAEEIQAGMYSTADINDPNLVGYWDFDEGEGQVAHDKSDNGNDGVLGGSLDPDVSDPNWVDSDAPVGICTMEELFERNINQAINLKLDMLEILEEALGKETAGQYILEQFLNDSSSNTWDKRDILESRRMVRSAVQDEEKAQTNVDQSIDKLEDSLDALG
ncbi:MAG: LamG domain-containing protein, partial [Planctomycetota bacterium]